MTLIKLLITSNTFKIINNNKKILLDHCGFVILHDTELLQIETMDQKGGQKKKKKEIGKKQQFCPFPICNTRKKKDETGYFLAT